MATERKSFAEMFGEILREIGALGLLFGILDGMLEERPMGWRWYGTISILCGALVAAGMLLELRRR
jgi:hypothetical protein